MLASIRPARRGREQWGAVGSGGCMPCNPSTQKIETEGGLKFEASQDCPARPVSIYI